MLQLLWHRLSYCHEAVAVPTYRMHCLITHELKTQACAYLLWGRLGTALSLAHGSPLLLLACCCSLYAALCKVAAVLLQVSKLVFTLDSGLSNELQKLNSRIGEQ